MDVAAHTPLRTLLTGGDRRGLARAAEALAAVEADPARVADLLVLTRDTDPLVVERAADLLEKLARAHVDWIEPHKDIFLGPLASSDRWEVRLQVVRALPLFAWKGRDRARAVRVLRANVAHPQLFVRAWALDGLATMAGANAALRAEVRRHMRAFERSGKKSLIARARQIRARLER